MARLARVVIPGCAHHVTQRGNHRQDVFLRDEDRRTYLTILRDCCERFELGILAWCLMSNHVHLVAVPHREDSLARALGRAQADYARWLHVRQRQIGHLWQNRFYSCPLEKDHLWDVIRYVELNPVRAGLVQHAREWRWSSAKAHLGWTEACSLTDTAWWQEHWKGGSWEEVLELGFREAGLVERIREATRTGRPLGSEVFTRGLEAETGRVLLPQKRGPKPRRLEHAGQMSLAIS